MIKNEAEMRPCQGPIVWFGAGPGAALLECSACGYIMVAGSLFDRAHQSAALLREGLAS